MVIHLGSPDRSSTSTLEVWTVNERSLESLLWMRETRTLKGGQVSITRRVPLL